MKYQLIRDIDNDTFEPRFRLIINNSTVFIYFNKNTSLLYISESNKLIDSDDWENIETEILKLESTIAKL